MNDFPAILRRLRTEAQWTQPELAQRLGISRSAVSMYELGAREPDFETLEAMAELFQVDMNTLLGKEKVPAGSGEHQVSDEMLKFALWGDSADIDEQDLADVKRYAAFIRERKRENQ